MLIYYSADTQHTDVVPISSGVQLSRSYKYWRNREESFAWGPGLCPAHLCRALQHGKGPLQLQPHVGLCPMLCLQIIFEGVRGTSYEGDIAIDDVTLKKGDCPRKPIVPNKGESVRASEENESVGMHTCIHVLGMHS